MPRQFVHREELGKLIAQTSGAISMINESNYEVRWRSGEKTYTVTAIKSGWTCSCPDYARHNAKCKHDMQLNYIANKIEYDVNELYTQITRSIDKRYWKSSFFT